MEKDAAHILECMDMAIVRLDAGLRITYHNRQAARFLGRPGGGLMGLGLGDLFAGPLQENLDREIARSVEDSASVSFDQLLPAAEGLWLSCRISPCEDGVILVLQDESEKKKAEDEMQANLVKYRVLFESFPLGVSITDKDGNIVETNLQAERLLALEKREHESRRIDSGEWRIIRPDGSPMPADEYASVRALKENHLVENVEMGIAKDRGEVTWINVTAAPIPPEGHGVAVTYGDITERKRIERELRESEARFRTLQEASFGGIAIHDQGVILDCNQGLSRMTGYSAEELVGMDGLELVAPQWRAIVRERIAGGYGEAYDVEGLRKNGSFYPLEIRGKNIPYHGRIVRVTEFRDISVRKGMEESLRESEERYRTLYQNLEQGVCEFDGSGVLVSANPAASRIIGVDLPDMFGIRSVDILSLLPPLAMEDGSAYTRDEELVHLTLETGRISQDNLVKIFNPVKNENVWIMAYTVPRIKPGQEKPSGVFVIFSDITSLKDAQESLRRLNEELEEKVQDRTRDLEETASHLQEQKELLQVIIDNIPVMIALLDPAGRVRLVNREFERITGWSLEEARSMDILAATHPDPVERQRAMEAVMRAETGWLDFRMATRSGRALFTSWANVRLSDGSAIGIGIDLSSRRQMEQDLLKLAAAAQQSGEGIALSSPEGVIEYVNPAYESISGYSRDELIGKNAGSFKDYFAGYSVQDIISRTLKEGRTWSGRQQRKRKTGETVEVDLSVSPVRDETGRVINFVSVLRDVTQETRLQKQLAISQRMEAIGSLAGGIAHDLKNILTPILINTEVALEDVGVRSPAYQVLEEVLDAARLGRDLVQQILTFSRRAPQEKTPVNIPAVIRETLAFLRSTLPSTIEISTELKDSCVMAFADPTQIKQVLINLGSNAGHAMQEAGGTLRVKESREDLDEETASLISPGLTPGPYVHIEVQDTGYGMDEETMEHIFEPFFTTKKGEGTGMGLAVAHGIVHEHQGAITVKSMPGKGSTFTILLPELPDGKEQDIGCRKALTA